MVKDHFKKKDNLFVETELKRIKETSVELTIKSRHICYTVGKADTCPHDKRASHPTRRKYLSLTVTEFS
jgi:hypothetical protein